MNGPQLVADGVRFRVLAPEATGVDVCLFSSVDATQEYLRLPLVRQDEGCWEIVTSQASVGSLYGYRLHGPWDPDHGLRFDPSKVLLDPWAREVARAPVWDAALHDHRCLENGAWEPTPMDSAAYAPLGRVIDVTEGGDTGTPPRIPWQDVVIYEVHPKGFTKLHSELAPEIRGTWDGLASAPVVEYLKSLGVTTIELLPVHAHVDDAFLAERGLTNYWGYSTLGYFAPHPAYAVDSQNSLAGFRAMVRTLHEAGLEVILDVVYNHSCEAGEHGPHLSLRGFGSHWYRRQRDFPRGHEDFTGCGNTLDFRSSLVRDFVRESLRFWVEVGGVDGFRLDLASVHGRMEGGFDPHAPFFAEVADDPVLSKCKWIAEPWDASWNGYGVGKFPAPWREWNDKFRDGLRRYWKGQEHNHEVALRFSGSPDLYQIDRDATASINFVACHDGFPLRDLATWSHKHNEANREGNRDGSDHEISDNLGEEGETLDPVRLSRRSRRVQNLLATTLLASGVPMLLSGDERGRTQGGNNNAWCQDSDAFWMSWSNPSSLWPQPRGVAKLLRLRKEMGAVRWQYVESDSPALRFVFTNGPHHWLVFLHSGVNSVRESLPSGLLWQIKWEPVGRGLTISPSLQEHIQLEPESMVLLYAKSSV